MNIIRKKTIALILSMCIVLSCVPFTTFAIDSKTYSGENIIDNNREQEATIVTEITEKREADKKVYLLSDGTYMSAVYPQQVHYEENGKWKDIDNSFVSGIDNDGDDTIENSKNSFKIKFANKAKNKKLVSIKRDEFEINWALNNSKKVRGETIACDSQLNTASSLKNINSAIIYKNILNDTDLKYSINSTAIKEDIILNSKNAPSSFTFDYEIKKLSYRRCENGNIEIYSDSNPDSSVFTIDKPYMYDSMGNFSDSVEMNIVETKKGFQIVIIPNEEWINSSERVFPITIDPTIITEQSASSIKDTTGVASSKTNQLYNALEANYNYLWLKVGRFYGTEAYSLVYVPLPSDISESCRILDAKMNLICYRAGISTATSNLTITAHEITTDWNQTTISDNKVLYFDELPEYEYIPADFMVLNDSSTNVHNKLYSFDITKIAQKWATGKSVNRGILLAGQNLPSTERYIRFYDSDNTVRNSDPCFTYTYRDTKGIEDYWTYTSLTAGRSGTAAVNNYNGNLVVSQNIAGIAGNRMPVSISAIYDSSSRSSNLYNLGKGWKTNYDMRIRTSTLNYYPFYLIDSDGTEHYFYGETTKSEWKDEDGLGYTLKRDSSVNNNGYLLTDKSNSKIYFRSDGQLSRMDDSFGNSVIISYNASSKISSIRDGAERTYTFSYNSSGLLSSITNPANRIVTFSYTNNNLTAITYPDGKSTTFIYGGYGLERINSPDGTYTKVGYKYSSNHLYTTALEYYGSNNILNTDYDLVYNHNSTTVTSNCDNTVNHTYQFDNYGKTVGVVNNIVYTAEYYNYGAPGGNATGTENKLLSASKTLQPTRTVYNDNDSYSNSSKWYVNPEATDTTINVDPSRGRNSAPSLKITQNNEYGGYSAVIFDAGVLKGGYNYDFSAYINTNGTSIDAPYGLYVSVYYYDSELGYNSYGSMGGSITSTFADDWIYSNSQLGFAEDQHCYVLIGCFMNSPGSFWVDDLQIQLGEGQSNYNYIKDNVFLEGNKNWVYKRNNSVATDDSVRFYDGSVCTFDGAYNEKRNVSQETNCRGKAGDTLIFGSRAVAYSVPTNDQKTGVTDYSTYRIRIELKGANGTATFTNSENIIDFNPYLDEWQFMSKALVSPIDFTSVTFYFEYDYNVYFAMFAAPFIFKELYGQSYTYDNNGNVVSTVDLATTEATFAYQNNNLSQMINPTGSRYSYSYNENTKALEYANSSDGQLFAFTYDQYGNVLSSTITAKQNEVQLENNSTYYIRNLTTGNAMKNVNSKLVNGTYATQNNTIRWNLISTGETDIYYIQPAGDTSKYLTVKDASASDKAEIILSSVNNSDSQKFKIISNNDGSFSILSKVSGYTKAIDGRDLNSNGSTELNKSMVQNTIDLNSGNQKWCFEKYVVNNQNQEKIIGTSTYTSNGNYVSNNTDVFGCTTSYQYNNDGTIHSTTDAKNNMTNYSYYDNSSNLKSVTSDNSTNTYTYENDRIKTITTANGTVYTFNYDAFGRNKSIDLNRANSTAASRRLVTYQYNSEDYQERFTFGSGNNLAKITYGNGYESRLSYSSIGLLDALDGALYYYDNNSNLISKTLNDDRLTDTWYYRDLAGRVINKTMNAIFDGSILYSLNYKYLNQKNLLDRYKFSSGTTDFTTSFSYDDLNKGEIPETVYGVSLNNNLKLSYVYDKFARQNSRTLYTNNANITKYYTFRNGVEENSTSYVVDSVTENGYTYNYSYDALGNIISYTKTNNSNNQVVESYVYRYDNKGQLVYAGTTDTNGTEYTYDANGNILTKKNLSTNATVSYGYTDPTWADLLTSYNGQAISYDTIGNPLNYNNGSAMSFTWVDGRNLATVTKNGSSFNYSYDAESNRISKLIGDVSTQYMIFDGIMYGERKYDANGETVIYYLYDENNNKYGFIYNGKYYYYQINLQGDIIGIYDENGQLVVQYAYDVWGKPLSVTGALASTIGQINPIRYRGYYYDNETGFYYLQSRYYDPETGRFINADSQLNAKDGILGYNLFAYCNNNPIMYSDPSGHSIILACIIVGAVIGGLAGGHIAAKVSKAQTGKVNGWAVAGGIVGGGVLGGLAGWGIGAAITAIGAAMTGAAGTVAAPVVEQVAEKASTALQTYYPPNNGFSGAIEKISLDVGTIIQRTGDLAGRFTAPAGTPSQMLSLPYDKIGQAITYLQTTQPIQALSGTVAPWFGQIGGGTQYLLLDGRVDQLLAEGILKIFGE